MLAEYSVKYTKSSKSALQKTGIAIFAENKRTTSYELTSERLASMRPSSQEAYASSGPRSPATHTSASGTHPAQRITGQDAHQALGGLLMLMGVSLVILAQRRHMLLEMRVSWMLIHKEKAQNTNKEK